jgi:hypothetical protein
MSEHYLHLVEKMIDERNKPSCEEQIAELSELADAYMNQYVHFKNMVFDIIEGKLSIEDAKIQMYGLERGYDQ